MGALVNASGTRSRSARTNSACSSEPHFRRWSLTIGAASGSLHRKPLRMMTMPEITFRHPLLLPLNLPLGLPLNLGAGYRPLVGYLNLDRLYAAEEFQAWRQTEAAELVAGDCIGLDVYPLTGIPDNSHPAVRSSHCLEHFSHLETEGVLREWVRVLQPGGQLWLAVPDIDAIITQYTNGTPDAPIEWWLMGGHTDGNDFHKAIFNEQKLRGLMAQVGLVGIQRWESEVDDCSAVPISLNLVGRKPIPGEQPVEQTTPAEKGSSVFDEPWTPPTALGSEIVMVMSRPRVGFTAFADCAAAIGCHLGIDLISTEGVFWTQAITDCFQYGMKRGKKYLLALDYDTIFTEEDVLSLYRVLEARPDIAALAALQSRRSSQVPLLTLGRMRDPNGNARIPLEELEQDTLRVLTAHFGCTLIRADALRQMAKPWFLGIPDGIGEWGLERLDGNGNKIEGRKDADIYFWHQLQAAGLEAHVCNRVVVGHQELMLAWPGNALQTVLQPLDDYQKNGKDPGVWR